MDDDERCDNCDEQFPRIPQDEGFASVLSEFRGQVLQPTAAAGSGTPAPWARGVV